ncbi:MAG TPA: subclass B3 metallo-beta-lactamase [Steroidobacteraceae bacterium]|nr:subclass B3 metallo-beta-lactamase [Steroidobacteraceae bacterium]
MMLSSVIFALAQVTADAPHACDSCVEWNQPLPAFHVYGNTWFVGTAGLGSVLITSDQGHVLIDGGLPQSAPLIAENIVRLGFRLEDVKLILNSHTHYDHAGGIAALQRASGARVAASPASRRALERGGPTPDDPQFAFGKEHNDYAPVAKVQVVKDAEELRVGALRIAAHFTPGHTPGGTSWTWQSCEGTRCLNLVYADSLNSVSAPGFRFGEHGRAQVFEHSMAVVAALPCDLLLAPHPVLIDMDAKLAALKAHPETNPFISTDACRRYADAAKQRLQARLAEEKAGLPAAMH